jgi:hypothetical protein
LFFTDPVRRRRHVVVVEYFPDIRIAITVVVDGYHVVDEVQRDDDFDFDHVEFWQFEHDDSEQRIHESRKQWSAGVADKRQRPDAWFVGHLRDDRHVEGGAVRHLRHQQCFRHGNGAIRLWGAAL